MINREEIVELHGDDTLFADGFDDAIIGVAVGFDSGRVIYSERIKGFAPPCLTAKRAFFIQRLRLVYFYQCAYPDNISTASLSLFVPFV